MAAMDTVRNNYGLFVKMEHCVEMKIEQNQDWLGPNETIHELIEDIPEHNLSQCAPLRD